ncbi:type III secretion system inner membrane ring lipoprotein SctJ [Burkholderia ubonensis]|uniref:type III secretion system inner membrane ring lipoprotein SctJ n=1 Tax=Burkholderia ubonensis TaxID=101571 RepID=UPI0009B3F859|nr:type III secretion inner membrane ring lipoprotein SctJ [Burkholderia ubonensis]
MAVLGLAFVLAACKGESLLQNLDQAQANEVMAALYRHNIPAEKAGTARDGYSVAVGRSDFTAAVDILKTYDLPSVKAVNVADMFPADSLVASPRAEKARLLSAVEQRLQQSVRALNGVVTARVHVAYDLDDSSDAVAAASSTRVSVLVVHDDSASQQGLVSDIKRLLKNSMPKLEYDNISVVPTRQSVLQHEPPGVVAKASPTAGRRVAIAAAVLLCVVAAGVLFYLVRSGMALPGILSATVAKLRKQVARRSSKAAERDA